MINKIIQEFKNHYKTNLDPMVFFAPGRVNVIGEHIDYNGGNVLPFAIEMGTYAVVLPRNDNIINLQSSNFSTFVSVTINEISYKNENQWANYPLGVVDVFQKSGYKIDRGFDVFFYGNLPNQAGLSSSASIELVTAVMLKSLFNFDISKKQLAVLCQKAENDFMGLNCGIMDQFAIANGKKGNAMFLNTNTLDFVHIPMVLDKYVFLITNTNKKRQLVESAYNKRLEECRTALTVLQKKFNINYLCQLPIEVFEQNTYMFDNEIILKRARHVITEQKRTLDTIEAMKSGNIYELGRLLNQSHYSLRDDYEVSCYELDILQNEALKIDGVAGSRMTGAGFGGCTISIVKEETIENFTITLSKNYFDATGLKADFYVVNSADGACKIL